MFLSTEIPRWSPPNKYEFSISRRPWPLLGSQQSIANRHFETTTWEKFAVFKNFSRLSSLSEDGTFEFYVFCISYLIMVVPGALHDLLQRSSEILSTPIDIDPLVEELIESPENSPEWNNQELRTQLTSVIESLVPIAQHIMLPYIKAAEAPPAPIVDLETPLVIHRSQA